MVGGGQQGVEEAGEPGPVAGQRGGPVPGRVRLEGEGEFGAVGAAEELQAQVGDRAGGQLVHGAGEFAEAQAAVEGDHVDHDGGGQAAGAGAAGLAAQFLAAEALVGEDLGGALGDVPEHGREVLLGADGDAQRQHVGEHGGRGERGPGGAGAHRQAEHQVLLLGEAVQVGGGRGEHHHRPVHLVAAGDRVDAGDPGRRLEPGGGGTGLVGGGQARRVGLVGEVGVPVRAVLAVLLGGTVGVVLGEQLGEADGVAGLGSSAFGTGGVQLGEAPPVQGLAVAVQHDVVVAQMEQVVVGGDLQQGVREQRALGQVDGGGEVLPHPAFGGGAGVRGAAQVVHAQAGDVLQRELPGPAVGVGGEPHPQRVGLVHGRPDGLGEVRLVDRAANVHVTGAVVRGAARVELVGDPHFVLGCGQRQTPREGVHESLLW